MTKAVSIKRILTFAAALVLTAALLCAFPAAASAETGAVANLVVMVRFTGDSDASDVFNNNWTAIRNLYDAAGSAGNDGVSLKSYINAVTDGQMAVNNYFPQETVTEGVSSVAPLVLDGVYSDYDDYSLVEAVIAHLNALPAPSGRLDNRESGVLDNLSIIVQGGSGEDETPPDDSNYATNVSVIDPHHSIAVSQTLLHGVLVRHCNFLNSYVLVGQTFMKQGVICHEFLHTLDLPDLYRYIGNSGSPVGPWDIMAGTSMYLQYPLSYSRFQKGWLNLTTVSSSGDYTLDCVSVSGSERRGYILSSPLSSEKFVLEYRIRQPNDFVNWPIDMKVPGSGLLIYRADPSYNTNAGGNNFLYVLRPGVTGEDGDAASLLTASIDPLGENFNTARTGYGSADLTATENTLYFSNGSNSGIVISNVSRSGSTLSFYVDFPDYTSMDLWDKLGESVASDASAAVCAADGSGIIYSAYDEYNTSYVKKFENNAWSQVGGSVGIFDPQLLCQDNQLYLLGSDASGNVKCFKLNSGAWTQIYSAPFSGATAVRFVNSQSGLYASFFVGSSVYIVNLEDASAPPVCQSAPPLANDLGNLSVCRLNGSFYASYLDYGSGYTCRAACLNGSSWVDIELPSNDLKFSDIATDGTNILLAAGCEGRMPRFFTYNGSAWSSEDITPLDNTTTLDLVMAGASPYVGGITGSSANYVGTVYQRGSGGWTKLGSNVASALSSMSLSFSGANIYAATVDQSSGVVNVRSKAASAVTPTPPPATPSPTPTTPPATPDYTVSVTPPSGYSDTTLWIDGVAYSASSSGGKLNAAYGSGNAKSVIMYKYNANGVPTGMYVWSLSFANNCYTAAAIPAFQDILSYHGFSIRVAGVSGIRFKSGIGQTLRAALLSTGGSNGYRLVNYGTLFTNNSYLSSFPFVYGGEHIGSGFAYWVENGTVNDRIFETVQGRYRFTSVITQVPDTLYNVQFAFRSFITLSKGGEQVKIYGPVVSRSIVAVANQVLAAGEFSSGSPGDVYVRNIVSAAARNP